MPAINFVHPTGEAVDLEFMGNYYSSARESGGLGSGSITPNVWWRVPIDTLIFKYGSGFKIDTTGNIGRFTLNAGLWKITYSATVWYDNNRDNFIHVQKDPAGANTEVVGSFRNVKRNSASATTITIEGFIVIDVPVTTDFEIQYRHNGPTNAQWGSGDGTTPDGDVVPVGSTQNSGTLLIEQVG